MKTPKVKCNCYNCDNYFNPDYEGITCQFCGNMFCISCEKDEIVMCENCGLWGCKDCIKYDKETGYYCSKECLEELKNEKN